MALVGQSIDNRLGDRITFRETPQSSAGQLVAFDLVVAPDAGSPPRHVHTRQAETFTVVSGTWRSPSTASSSTSRPANPQRFLPAHPTPSAMVGNRRPSSLSRYGPRSTSRTSSPPCMACRLQVRQTPRGFPPPPDGSDPRALPTRVPSCTATAVRPERPPRYIRSDRPTCGLHT